MCYCTVDNHVIIMKVQQQISDCYRVIKLYYRIQTMRTVILEQKQANRYRCNSVISENNVNCTMNVPRTHHI